MGSISNVYDYELLMSAKKLVVNNSMELLVLLNYNSVSVYFSCSCRLILVSLSIPSVHLHTTQSNFEIAGEVVIKYEFSSLNQSGPKQMQCIFLRKGFVCV